MASLAPKAYRWILLFIFVVTVILGLGALKFRISKDLSFIVPKGHINVALNQEIERDFGGGNLISVGLIFEDGGIFDKRNLKIIYHATQSILDMEGVYGYRVLSIAAKKLRYAYTTKDPDGVEVLNAVPFMELVKRSIKGDLWAKEALKQAVIKDPHIFGTLVSKDLKGALIQADFSPYVDPTTIYKRVSLLRDELKGSNPQLKIVLGGQPVEVGTLLLLLKRLFAVFVLSMVLISIVLFGMFRSKRGVLLPISGALLSLVWCLGIMGYVGVKLDAMTITAPLLIVAISVGHSIQVLKRYYENFVFFKEKIKSANTTIRQLLKPTCAGIITDGAGFMSLAIFPFDGLRHMGIFAGIGILSIFFTVLLYIPIMCCFMRNPNIVSISKPIKIGAIGKFLLRVSMASKSNARFLVLACILTFVLFCAYGASKIRYGDLQEGSPLFWPKSSVNRDLDEISNRFAGYESYLVQIKGKGDGAIANVALLEQIDKLERILISKPYVGYVSSYVDILKHINYLWAKTKRPMLPASDQLAYVYLEMFVSGGGDPEDTRSYFTMDYSRANVLILLKDRKEEHLNDLEKTIANFIKSQPPIEAISINQAGGSAALYKAAVDEIESLNMENVFIVAVVVLMLALLTFKSIVAAGLLLFPLVLASLFTAAIMGISRFGVFIPTVPVASLGIGVGVDFSFYVLSRILEEKRSGISLDRAIFNTLISSGKAVIFTSLTLSLASLTLLLTGLKVHGYLGGLLALDLFANMIFALAIMPFILRWIVPKFLDEASCYGKTK